ncbi:ankyrin repeat domain-containing protein 66 isoform X1 [Gadus macrocephalus]|uniref:ankyrin repeat domain-containing protein 66 isoform X1 n=1 Tax=Gadus macrocephalus TaxID=80720 RepID=UPI0028CB2B31|nr:ankyrin repeat domain-containing protein 66 isoform X1 [Gadus macrocephalus]
MTELHQAAAAGDCDLVEELLKNNQCDPNQRDLDWNHKTPLHWAAAKGQTEIVRLLVESGGRSCLRTDNGWTAAHFAAEAGRLGVLRLLHAFHAPVDKQDISGDRPIRLAEMYGHEDCVSFLQIAEVESEAYRQSAVQKGLFLDETDEEWEDRQKENGMDFKK